MYAITNNAKKVLTALLCAVLVFSLTPGFTASAFAAGDPNAVVNDLVDNTPNPDDLSVGGPGPSEMSGSSGQATTDVNIVVFDGKLRTEATDSFAATRAQISAEGSVFSYLQVNGSCSYGDGADDYTFSWSVTKDGEPYEVDLTEYVSDTAFSNNIAHSELDLAALVEANDSFTDGSLYVFSCVVVCGPEEATETIEIATIDQESSYKDIRRDATSGNGYAAVAFGGFHTGAKLLAGPISHQNESFVAAAFTDAAANPPEHLVSPKGGYLAGDITSAQVTGTFTFNGTVFPAYLGDDLSLLIPVDNGVEKNSYTGEPLYTYGVGDTIYVLNMGSGDTEVKWYEATIVEDDETYEGEGGLKALVHINSGDAPVMPGFFSLVYSPEKRDPDAPPITYYTIVANDATANGNVTAQGADVPRGIWEVGKDAVYNLAPHAQTVMPDGSMYAYAVDGISFAVGDGDPSELASDNVMADGTFIEDVEVDGVTFSWDAVNSNLSIIGCVEDTYMLNVTFSETFIAAPEEFEEATIQVRVVMEDGSTDIGSALVNAEYYEFTEGMSSLPDITDETLHGTSDTILHSTKGYDATLRALDGVRGEDDIVLAEVWTGDTFDDMVRDETFTRSKVFSDDICVKFVYKVDDSGHVITFERTATIMIDEAGHGAIDAGDGERVLSTTRQYVQSLPGATVTFIGQDGWFADRADVYETATGRQIHSGWLLNNVHESQVFDWNAYANHGEFDVTFVVHFSPMSDVGTYRLDIADSENGSLVPSGWVESEDHMYAVRTNLPVKVKADSGYRIESDVLAYNADDEDAEPVHIPVIGGVAAFDMPAHNTRLEATFVVAEKPFDDAVYDLNIYVAGDIDGNDAIAYVSSDMDAVKVVPSINEKTIDPSGYAVAGSIFGATALHTQVAATTSAGYPDFDMSCKADEGARIEKILVVKYNETDGVKSVKSAVLYYTLQPTFTLESIDSDTDVMVYFKENKPAIDVPEYEWVDVTVNVNHGTQLYPNSTVSVVRGSDLPNTFAPVAGYMWGTLNVSGDEIWTPVGSVDEYDFTLENVQGGEVVNVNFVEEDETVDTPWKVSASNGRGGSIDANQGGVSLTKVDNTIVSVGRFGVPMADASNFTVNVKGAVGYSVSDLMFVWDGDAKAYVNRDDQTIYFVNADVEMSGFATYTSGSSMKSMFPEGRFVDWKVRNLMSDIDIVPMFTGGKLSSDIDDGDYYTVTAKVKSGLGTITNDVQTGWPVKLARSEDARTIRVDVNPYAGYEVEHVSVMKRMDGLAGIWEAFVGLFTGETAAQMYEKQAIQNGYIELEVDGDYDIEVAFADPNKDPQSDSRVAVNVASDPLRGTVSPGNTVLLNKRGGNTVQRYVVNMREADNGKLYAIKDVKVRYTPNGETAERVITVIPTLSSVDGSVTWNPLYYNEFKLDVSVFGLSDENMNPVNVTVEYADAAELDPGDITVLPESKSKTVSITVLADGIPVVGSNNVGGYTMPEGEFTMTAERDSAGGYVKQYVDVIACDGYDLTSIEVNGVVSSDYLSQVVNTGHFIVSGGPVGDEDIVVKFTQKSVAESNYTIDTTISGNGTIIPSGTLVVPVNEGRYYSVYPNAEGIGVVAVKDQYKDADGNILDFAPGTEGLSVYTRADGDTSIYEGLMVHPVKVSGKVVDRFITVVFGSMEPYGGSGGESYIPDEADRVNIKLNVWGNARDAFINGVTPNGNMLGVEKKQGVVYGYTFILPTAEIAKGAYVYAIDVNGERYWGNKATQSTRAAAGTIVLRYDDLYRKDNTVDVYVRYFDGTVVGAFGNIIGISGPGGVIFEQNVYGDVTKGRSYNARGIAAVESEMSEAKSFTRTSRNAVGSEFGGFGMQDWGGEHGVDNGNANIPHEFYMVPDGNGSYTNVVDEVHLKNCDVVAFAWMYPKDVPGYESDARDGKVALKYVLKLKDASKDGICVVTYRSLKSGESTSDNAKDWDETKVAEKEDLNELAYTMRIEVTPDDAVNRLTNAADQMHDELFVKPIGNLWVNGRSEHDALGQSWSAIFDTVNPDKFTINDDGTFTYEVGNLIKWDAKDPESSVIYAVDADSLGNKFTVTPLMDTEAIETAKNYAGGQAGDPDMDSYYKRYIVSGKVSDLTRNGTELSMKLPLTAVPYAEGFFPEFAASLPGNGTDHIVTVKVNNTSYGTVTPVEFDGEKWFGDSRSVDMFSVKDGTQVAFKIEPKSGYRLWSVKRNDGAINCVANGEYSIPLQRVAFAVTSDTELDVEFRSEADARVPITVIVEGSGGTTEPTPGRTYDCPVGDYFTLTLKPTTEQGFIPNQVKILVDDQVVETMTIGSTQRIVQVPNTYTWQPLTVVASFRLNSDINLSQTGMPDPTQIGAFVQQTGDKFAFVFLMAAAIAGVGIVVTMLEKKRKRYDKYRVTPRG